jgi:hypothetical protein
MKQGREIRVDEEQREAERAALRNVRGLLDRIEAEEEKGRKLLRAVLLAAGVLLVLGALFFAQLLLDR